MGKGTNYVKCSIHKRKLLATLLLKKEGNNHCVYFLLFIITAQRPHITHMWHLSCSSSSSCLTIFFPLLFLLSSFLECPERKQIREFSLVISNTQKEKMIIKKLSVCVRKLPLDSCSNVTVAKNGILYLLVWNLLKWMSQLFFIIFFF